MHKKFVVACMLITNPDGQIQKEVQTFGTTTWDLLALLEWLYAAGCTHVALESTGAYWRPVYNPEITPTDLMSLPNLTIYLKLMIDGVVSRPFSAETLQPFSFLTHNTYSFFCLSSHLSWRGYQVSTLP